MNKYRCLIRHPSRGYQSKVNKDRYLIRPPFRGHQSKVNKYGYLVRYFRRDSQSKMNKYGLSDRLIIYRRVIMIATTKVKVHTFQSMIGSNLLKQSEDRKSIRFNR